MTDFERLEQNIGTYIEKIYQEMKEYREQADNPLFRNTEELVAYYGDGDELEKAVDKYLLGEFEGWVDMESVIKTSGEYMILTGKNGYGEILYSSTLSFPCTRQDIRNTLTRLAEECYGINKMVRDANCKTHKEYQDKGYALTQGLWKVEDSLRESLYTDHSILNIGLGEFTGSIEDKTLTEIGRLVVDCVKNRYKELQEEK